MQTAPWTRVSVRRTHLELGSPDQLAAVEIPSALAGDVALVRRDPIGPGEYLALYKLVGERWIWRDRLEWTEAQLVEYLADPTVSVWTPTVRGETAGYFELKHHTDRSVEVMYFGLAPAFIGRGLGGWLLTAAVREAFALGAKRIALNTCTLDAPQALPNYLARGFRVVSEDQYLLDVQLPEGIPVREQVLPSADRPVRRV